MKFKIIVVTFHPKLSADEIFDRADEVRCSQLSYLHVSSFKNDVEVKVVRKEEVVKTRKVFQGLFVMTFAAKSSQRLCHDSNFPIPPMTVKVLVRETETQTGQPAKPESIVLR